MNCRICFRFIIIGSPTHRISLLVTYRKATLSDSTYTTGFRQISCTHTEQGLETHIQQIQFYPHIHLFSQFSRTVLSLGGLLLSCRAIVPFSFRLLVRQLNSRVTIRGSTLVYPPFIYFYFRPIWTHIAAMDHHIFANIDTDVGRARRVIRPLKEYQIARSCVFGRYSHALLP